jgi:hypothetical protein
MPGRSWHGEITHVLWSGYDLFCVSPFGDGLKQAGFGQAIKNPACRVFYLQRKSRETI